VEDDPRRGFTNKWQINMGNAPMEEPLCCLYGGLCPVCATYQMRVRALRGDMTKYSCCQGYFNMCCINAGQMGESSSPECCLCLEACCCTSCAVSANRFYIMDEYSLVSDPCDNRIIRFNNCVQLLDCIVSILAIFVSELRDAADVLDCIAKCVYFTTVGCMTAQQHRELKFRENQGNDTGAYAPSQMEMNRNAEPGKVTSS